MATPSSIPQDPQNSQSQLTHNSDPAAKPDFDSQRTLPFCAIYTDRTHGVGLAWGIGAVLVSGRHRKELSQVIDASHGYAADVLAVTTALNALHMACRVTVYGSIYVCQTMRGEVKRGVDMLTNWNDLDFAAMKHDITWTETNTAVGNQDANRAFALAVLAFEPKKEGVE